MPPNFVLYEFNPLSERLTVLQDAACTECSFSGIGFFDMSFVSNDKVINDKCPSCATYNLRITTYDKRKKE